MNHVTESLGVCDGRKIKHQSSQSLLIFRWSLLAVGLLISCISTTSAECAEVAPAVVTAGATEQTASNLDEIQDILYLTPKQPLLIRLHLIVNGEGFRGLRRKWAESQFASFDQDQNGVLEGAEVERLETFGRSSSGSIPLASVETDPADGKITPQECTRYLVATSGTLFSLNAPGNANTALIFANGRNGGANVNLFPKLDTNRDGKLSKEEIDQAAQVLRKYDRNEDDIILSSELQQSLPEEQRVAQDQLTGALSHLVIINQSDQEKVTARRLLETYDKSSRDPVSKTFRKDEKLSKAELSINTEEFDRADKNHDGKLDRNELTSLAAMMTPAVELEIQAPDSAGKFTVKSLRSVDQAWTKWLNVNVNDNGFVVLKLDETEIALSATEVPKNATEQLRTNTLAQFKQMDQDNNEYLTANELTQFGYANAFFAQADADGDQKVFESEFKAQIDRELALSQSSVTLDISSDGLSLFRLIDNNPADGRLSPRELTDIPQRFSQWDGNQDGMISLSELAIQLGAVFRPGLPRINGRPNFVGFEYNANRNMNANTGTADRPAWFIKMDRNRDGDLSPREFLGRRKLFDQIDTNHDGLISPDEAKTVSQEGAAKP